MKCLAQIEFCSFQSIGVLAGTFKVKLDFSFTIFVLKILNPMKKVCLAV